MTVFNNFLEGIDDRSKRERMEQIFTWIRHHYPHLKQEKNGINQCIRNMAHSLLALV